jgi:hypothetical protein
MQKFQVQAVPASATAALGVGPKRLMGFYLYGGSAASSVEFKNGLTDTGTVLFSADCAVAIGQWVDLSEMGGITFDVGCFCKPAGTGAIVYAFFEG